MSVWDTYQARCDQRGDTRRQTQLRREQTALLRRVPDNLSYQEATIYRPEVGFNITQADMSAEAEKRCVAIINSDNLNEKTILSLPHEDIENGSLIEWMDNFWLVTERDANTTVYTKAKLLQCNHLLRFLTNDGELCEQWCVIEDGTKYLTGEYEDRNFVVTRGDSRIYMTIARNTLTAGFGRDRRFIIDDPDSQKPLAYALTKPLKLGWTYGENGVYKFVLQEVTTTDYDDLERHIADYYKVFPRQDANGVDIEQAPEVEIGKTVSDNGKKVWL